MPKKEQDAPKTVAIARALVEQDGALEVVLMLADFGSVTYERIGEQFASEDLSLDKISSTLSRLSEVGVVLTNKDTYSLTERGAKIVERLQSAI